ncbi:hypothetical protein [Tellurirhabdus bombi]|uniref:hypothetical protein n=1 Tax=Tellurirhabdus bombi TaxID=2907205 RepID=UPI001F39137E|nr:hypothetical protein [Tellurirhabdus bombi]
MKSLLISFACLVGLIACSSDANKEASQKPADTTPIHTLIFMDKSVSVNINKGFVAQKYQQAINDIIDQNIKKKGDKLEVYFIHENTSKARALSLTTRSELDAIENANATDREAAQTSFDLSLNREKALFRQRVIQQLAQQNTSASNQETDIWASLPVIAKANENGAAVKVYYLSDMVESTKGTDRRDFHTTPPKDNAQADDWAKADTKKLKQYTLGSPDIAMILPFEPNASVKENNPAVTQYWQTLFQELGAANVEEQ